MAPRRPPLRRSPRSRATETQTAFLTFSDNAGNGTFGTSLGAGDLDGDRFSDVALGCPTNGDHLADLAVGSPGAGTVGIFAGASPPPMAPGHTLTGAATFGTAIAR
jgi:hypothetical protein